MAGEFNNVEYEINRLLSDYRLQKAQNNHIAAEECLSQAEKLCPGHIKIVMVRADMAFDNGDFKLAQKLYDDVFKRDRQNQKAESRLRTCKEKIALIEKINENIENTNDGIVQNRIENRHDDKENKENEIKTTEKNVSNIDSDVDRNDDTEDEKVEKQEPSVQKEITKESIMKNIDVTSLSARELSFIVSAQKSAAKEPNIDNILLSSGSSGKNSMATKAAIRSMFLPGVGQIYNDEVSKGVVLALSYVVIVFYIISKAIDMARVTNNGQVISKADVAVITFMVIVALGIWIYSMVDAYNNA